MNKNWDEWWTLVQRGSEFCVCNMIFNGCALVIWLMVCKFARASSLLVACVIFLYFCLNMMAWLFGTRC